MPRKMAIGKRIEGLWTFAPEELAELKTPWSYRQDQAAIEEMARSIAAEGQIQPGIVRETADGTVEVVVGNKRLLAIQLINRNPKEWDVREPLPFSAIPRKITDEEVAQWIAAENDARSDHNAVERAFMCRDFEQKLGLERKAVAARLRVSPGRVAQLQELLKLPKPVRDRIIGAGSGKDGPKPMKEALGRALVGLAAEQRDELVKRYDAGEPQGALVREARGEKRATGKQIGLSIAELREHLKPLADDGNWRAVALSELLSGKPGPSLAEILGEEAEEKA